MSSRTWMVHTDRLLNDEKLASVVLRLMIAMNDLGITNSEMYEWERSETPEKAALAWRGTIFRACADGTFIRSAIDHSRNR
jgi:hypothetical protein